MSLAAGVLRTGMTPLRGLQVTPRAFADRSVPRGAGTAPEAALTYSSARAQDVNRHTTNGPSGGWSPARSGEPARVEPPRGAPGAVACSLAPQNTACPPPGAPRTPGGSASRTARTPTGSTRRCSWTSTFTSSGAVSRSRTSKPEPVGGRRWPPVNRDRGSFAACGPGGRRREHRFAGPSAINPDAVAPGGG